ncbi:MAG: hypothetical protein AB1730_04505 [Myxococcota bacterium]
MDDLSRRSLRELLTLARQRLGRAAAGLKTRAELLAALRQGDGHAAPNPATAPPTLAPAPAPARDASPPPAAVVTRDFFVARRSPGDPLG